MMLGLTISVLFGSLGDVYADNIYKQISGGRCETLACVNKETYKSMSGGRCETLACVNKETYKSMSGGRCETLACYCSLYPCPVGRSYDYDVSGYGNGEYVSGSIDASRSSKDVDGYITLEDGREVSFDGEWVGNGEIEGYDEDGNYYELEVD